MRGRHSCALAEEGARLGDEGTSLMLDMPGEDEPDGLTPEQVGCIFGRLDMPEHVLNRMGQTRALDGMQDAEWGDYTASWTYHPDSGLDVILVHAPAGD
jgi:hypothetical protein